MVAGFIGLLNVAVTRPTLEQGASPFTGLVEVITGAPRNGGPVVKLQVKLLAIGVPAKSLAPVVTVMV